MAQIEISDKKLVKAYLEYIEDCGSTQEFQQLVYKQLKFATDWEDFDWSSIKKLVDKNYNRQIEE
jgi:hypothetical protein